MPLAQTAPSTPGVNETAPARIDANELLAAYRSVRAVTEDLVAELGPEDQNLQPMPEASPVKWHRAHTTWFFETFILDREVDGWKWIEPAYRQLFNSYYNGIGRQHPRDRRHLIGRPDYAEVTEYRRRIDRAMTCWLEQASPESIAAASDRLVLGLNHEQQHQELILTDYKAAMVHNPLARSLGAAPASTGTATPQAVSGRSDWLAFDGGEIELGHSGSGFAFDNETPRHRAILNQGYELARRPVSCAEWRAFIDDGGYREPLLWLSDGWAWVRETGANAPAYWHDDGHVQTLAGLRKPSDDEPVTHINLYEAAAFAEWAGARLPTEAEWEHAAGRRPVQGHLQTAAAITRRRTRMEPTTASSSSCSAASGNGPSRPTCPIPVLRRPRAPSASTTENSWPIRWCCAEEAVPRPPATSAQLPEFLLSGRSLAIHRPPPGSNHFMMDTTTPATAMTDADASTDTDRRHSWAFLDDALSGLGRRPRSLPCKYLYDERGSALFEEICDTDEYYVTRADIALHRAHLDDIARAVGPAAHLIEFGSGAGIKIRMLLEACVDVRAYTPIEISREALDASVVQLTAEFPDLDLRPVQADYTRPLPDDLKQLDPPARRRVVYFPGSTISNFDHASARDFLGRMAAIAGPDGAALVGVDLVKDESRLIAAYDDRAGITAAFNKNLLERLIQELDATIELDAFRHEARYNREHGRIEMHLVATRTTVIELDNRQFEFAAGESIHTENSHKYTIEGFRRLARSAGLEPVCTWTDPEALFSMHFLEPTKHAEI